MALCFQIFGTDDELPTPREILDVLEESDFEVSIELEEEDEDNEREWTELLIYESSLEEPVTVYILGLDELDESIATLKQSLRQFNGSIDLKEINHQVDNIVVGFRIEYPNEDLDDENPLLMSHLIAQILTQKTSGFFTVDEEAIFDETGDLLLELAEVEED